MLIIKTQFMKSLYTFLIAFFSVTISFSQIVITEISYNPPESGSDSLEYIELYNSTDIPFDLTGATFADGIEFTFPDYMLAGDSYVCICINESAMQTVFGKTCLKWEKGGLKNGGEAITLLDKDGNELDHVEYGDDNPWPSSADGTDGEGASIVLCDPFSDNSIAENWSAAKNNLGIELNGKILRGSPGENNEMSCTLVPDHIIEARPDNTFAPDDITINPGEIVQWVNMGGFHNVNGDKSDFPDNPESFGNGAASNDSWTFEYTFMVEGIYEYQCDPHAGLGMKGKITVGTAKTYPSYTIGQLRGVDSEGKTDSIMVDCEVTGTVHGVNYSTSNGLNFFLIDDNHDGISIYNPNNTLGYTVNEGDEITVRGTVGQYNGLSQITADVINANGDGTIQSPIVVDTLSEESESRLVQLNNFDYVDESQWKGDGSSFNVQITNGEYTATMRVLAQTELSNMTAPQGPFNVIGLGSQFDFTAPYFDFYQIYPRSSADIIPISNSNDELIQQITIVPSISEGQFRLIGGNTPAQITIHGINGTLINHWDKISDQFEINNYKGLAIISVTIQNNRKQFKVFIK